MNLILNPLSIGTNEMQFLYKNCFTFSVFLQTNEYTFYVYVQNLNKIYSYSTRAI